MWVLHEAPLSGPEHVATARLIARRVAAAMDLEPWAQSRFGLAVAEAARLCLGAQGQVRFGIDAGTPPVLLAEISGASSSGPHPDHDGLRRLVDTCEITAASIRLGRLLHGQEVRSEDLHQLRSRLGGQLATASPLEEMAEQDRDLLQALAESDRVNSELEDTNRGVVALYAELDERAEQLRQASELKSRFLSNMSHEFRTPLNSILALARLLLDRADGPLTEEQEKQVGYIRRSAESLAELVNDLLDLAKVEAGKLELRPQHSTVPALLGGLRGVLKPLQQSDAVELVFEDAVGCPPLFTDEPKVAQILRNLVSNALKFTEIGEVRVSASFDRVSGHCVFTVRDTGVGIASENHEVVFHEFSQVANRLQGRAKGTGLGLPLSRRLAELLGGTLALESELGVGSTFTLSIPPVLPGAESTAPAMPPGSSELGGVLLIDDEETSRYVLRQMLAGIPGIRILEAENGPQGLRRAIEHRPDIILLDLRMPAMDGFEVLDRLSATEETRTIPVVICSSSVLESADLARLTRAKGVLPKGGLSREAMAAAVAPFLQAG